MLLFYIKDHMANVQYVVFLEAYQSFMSSFNFSSSFLPFAV